MVVGFSIGQHDRLRNYVEFGSETPVSLHWYHPGVKEKDPQSPLSDRPLSSSYWVLPGRLLAGEHPLGGIEAEAATRIRSLSEAGIDFYVDLTEQGEQPDYRPMLDARVEYLRSPIMDTGVPFNVSQTQGLLSSIRAALGRERRVYVHCRAGIGRTGLIVGCFLAEEEQSGRKGITRLNRLWRQSARAATWPQVPQTAEQADYIRHWLKLRDMHAKTGK